MAKYYFILAICVLVIGNADVKASHNLAGQISCKYVSSNKYELLLTTYTDPAPAQVDRCVIALEIWNSAGVLVTKINNIPRENGPIVASIPNCNLNNPHLGEAIYQTVKENIYRSTYNFPGAGRYLIRFFDPTRRADIKNITDAGNVNFYVETELLITNPLAGNNNTPILLNRPLDEACVGKLWTHNPGGYDPDGDSLVYRLTPSQQYSSDNGPFTPIPATGYLFPDHPNFGFSSFDIDPQTGVMTWFTPQAIGVYNIAYIVEEYRNGVLLGHVLRDMVIIVKGCNNSPPQIKTLQDTCITVNDTLRFPFLAYDPNVGDSVYLSLNNANIGNNGPFAVQNPAQIIITKPLTTLGLPASTFQDTIKGELVWGTICENIRKAPYQVDFYAHDNFSYIGAPGNAMLSAHHATSIQVIPPAPTDLTLYKGNHTITLDWTPSFCPNARGYTIYRKSGNSPFQQDTICCDLSPKQIGFTWVAFVSGAASHTFIDSLIDIEDFLSNDICYVVTANFGVNFIPEIESCASNMACTNFISEALYLTHADVQKTDYNAGEIFIDWAQPERIDSFFVPPYSYKLYRANHNQYPAIELATLNWGDTSFLDTGINTEIRGYNYRIEVVDALGTTTFTNTLHTNQSSSIYLTVQADAGAMSLQWRVAAGWENTLFEIERSTNGGITYAPLVSIAANGSEIYTYQDTGLYAETHYCYKIRSTGSHNTPTVVSPLINYSNEVCGFPRENEPPCNPNLALQGNCENFTHTLTFSKIEGACDNLTSYLTLEYSTSYSGPYAPIIDPIPYTFSGDTTFVLNYGNNQAYYSGCYRVIATNVYGSDATPSSPICLDYCPEFELPNIFTPNGDGVHEYFIPIKQEGVLVKAITIYDRWGVSIHRATNPLEYLWDGKNSKGKAVSEGVYYYVVEYEIQKFSGNIPQYARGWVVVTR